MSDEFGDDPSFYIFPKDHEDGTPFGDDFYERLTTALESEGLAWEAS